MAGERKVDFFDAQAFGLGAEFGFASPGAAAEEDAFSGVHTFFRVCCRSQSFTKKDKKNG